ncbi:MAG TPA: YraN family protein [Phycisphaerales bacterium]|nr:YraN family protein [Phycisphaerales bacterium]
MARAADDGTIGTSPTPARRSGFAWALREFMHGLLGGPSKRDPLGHEGETLAAKYLKKKGYRILGRNLRVRGGEGDLLALAPDRETIVLVEVKSRRVRPEDPPQPPPEASVQVRKRRQLRRVLRRLRNANGWHARPMRIDVVAIEFVQDAEPVVRHHEGGVGIEALR